MDDNKKYRHDLEVRNKELDTLFYKASHDLKAPVATLDGLCHLLKSELTMPGSKLFSHLEDTVRKLKDQNQVLLQLARINEVSPDYKTVPLETILSKALGGNENLFDLHLVWEMNEINTDSFLMTIVLKNIFDNALLYTEQKPHVDFTFKVTDGFYRLILRDYGSGIKKELQEKVFDMFFRGTDKSKGSGLGLYLSRKSIEKMNGEIEVVTPDGPGNQFQITLPIPK
jgi:signal transduction histidine kinase